MPVGLETCLRHGERSEPGGKSTTKNDRTAVWGTGRRESLREKWRHTAAVLPPPGRKKGSRKSYHYVRGVRGQVTLGRPGRGQGHGSPIGRLGKNLSVLQCAHVQPHCLVRPQVERWH